MTGDGGLSTPFTLEDMRDRTGLPDEEIPRYRNLILIFPAGFG